MSIFTFAIETSCDETSAAVLKDSEVLSNVISSQFFHKEYGGIVPELASRAHIKTIDKIVIQPLKNRKLIKNKSILLPQHRGRG
jgi:N6-L-threonylcarbamoyladenine synthase